MPKQLLRHGGHIASERTARSLLALALGRGVRQDQWRDALSVACGGSRRRGNRTALPHSQNGVNSPRESLDDLRSTSSRPITLTMPAISNAKTFWNQRDANAGSSLA